MSTTGKRVLGALFFVVVALTIRAGRLPGAGVAWPEVRLSSGQLRQEMAKVLGNPPVPGLEALVSSWKESLAGQRADRAHLHLRPAEMALLEGLLREDGFARLESFLRGEPTPPTQTRALMAAALITASALNRLSGEESPSQVFRGEAFHERDLAALQPGREVVEQGFSTALPSRQAAEKTLRGSAIRGGIPVLLSISSWSGRPVSVKGCDPIVVFLPETRFKVKSRKRQQGLTIVSLEELRPQTSTQGR